MAISQIHRYICIWYSLKAMHCMHNWLLLARSGPPLFGLNASPLGWLSGVSGVWFFSGYARLAVVAASPSVWVYLCFLIREAVASTSTAQPQQPFAIFSFIFVANKSWLLARVVLVFYTYTYILFFLCMFGFRLRYPVLLTDFCHRCINIIWVPSVFAEAKTQDRPKQIKSTWKVIRIEECEPKRAANCLLADADLLRNGSPLISIISIGYIFRSIDAEPPSDRPSDGSHRRAHDFHAHRTAMAAVRVSVETGTMSSFFWEKRLLRKELYLVVISRIKIFKA